MTGFDLSTISGVYVGSTEYSKIYYGSTLLWLKEEQLPYDAEIEYIETTGTLYINTGIKSSQYPIKLDTEIYLTNVSGEKAISGNSYPGSSGGQVFTFGVYNTKFFIWAGSSSYLLPSRTANANTWYNVQYELPDSGTRKVTINGTEYSNSISNGSVTDNTHDIFLLFEGNNAGKIPNVGRIKYAKYYIGGTLVRDFIPVRIATIGYLYDKVSKQLFANSGTGNFGLGPDTRVINTKPYSSEIEYLEASGNPYINTGVINDSTVVIDMKFAVEGTNLLSGSEPGTSGRFKWGCGGTGALYFGYGSTNNNYQTVTIDQVFTIHLEYGNQYVKDSNNTTVLSNTATISAFNTKPILLFRLYSGGSVTSGNGTTRIYSCNIYKNGNKVLELIPVRVGQEGCMYDKVSNSLFINASTGSSFSLGPDKTS